jgi:hypothetical protein
MAKVENEGFWRLAAAMGVAVGFAMAGRYFTSDLVWNRFPDLIHIRSDVE